MNNKQEKINELKNKWWDLLKEIDKQDTPLTLNQISKIVDLDIAVNEIEE